jgi:hypothetical protein
MARCVSRILARERPTWSHSLAPGGWNGEACAIYEGFAPWR